MTTQRTIEPTTFLTVATLLVAALLGSAPAEPAAAQSRARADADYVLGTEDVIEVFVWKEPDLSTTVTVRPDGRITLPLAGELEAAGKTPEALQTEVAGELESFIERPVVTVIVKEINSRQISVLGEVRRPGRYRITQRTTILDAIALGGGFTEFAHRNQVLVLRKTESGTRRMRVNVKQVLRDGTAPIYLEPGDTVYVD